MYPQRPPPSFDDDKKREDNARKAIDSLIQRNAVGKAYRKAAEYDKNAPPYKMLSESENQEIFDQKYPQANEIDNSYKQVAP
jgi:hypothetical protein